MQKISKTSCLQTTVTIRAPVGANNKTNTLCRSEGGHLASVYNQRIQNFLVEENQTGIWIGAHQPGIKEDWKWSDCTPWNWTMWSPSYYGQPNNYGGFENCAMIYWYDKQYDNWYKKWHDVGCPQKELFVCSTRICDITPTITPTLTTTNNSELEKKGIFVYLCRTPVTPII